MAEPLVNPASPPVPAQASSAGATYDANSGISNIAYPSGFTARYGYNALGYANQLSDSGSNQVHWTANAMDAVGHLTQQTAGNGLVTTR